VSDLAALAEAVVGGAHSGEQLEVYVARGHDTEIRAYDGQIDPSRRPPPRGGRAGAARWWRRRHRLGFAWAGSLEDDVVAVAVAEARDNAAYATPDPSVALAAPDGVSAAELDLWDPTSRRPDRFEGRHRPRTGAAGGGPIPASGRSPRRITVTNV